MLTLVVKFCEILSNWMSIFLCLWVCILVIQTCRHKWSSEYMILVPCDRFLQGWIYTTFNHTGKNIKHRSSELKSWKWCAIHDIPLVTLWSLVTEDDKLKKIPCVNTFWEREGEKEGCWKAVMLRRVQSLRRQEEGVWRKRRSVIHCESGKAANSVIHPACSNHRNQKKKGHTSYLSWIPQIYPCKFFLASVNFYRFNANSWLFTV